MSIKGWPCKGKYKPEEQNELIYQKPCNNCDQTYISEMERLFRTN